MKYAIEINNLKKTYKGKKEDKIALDDVDIKIPEGAFYGLLGPNGAGKSTLINIMAGLVNKSSGIVKVNGFDLDKNPMGVRRSLGVVPQEIVIDPFFSVYETLEIYAGYFGIRKKDRRTDEILNALNLTDKADLSPRRLSGGMKRRLLIAKALVQKPEIIILDEPTAGVDVDLRTQLWDYVTELNKQGTTILLTTHYLEEAEQLCEEVSIIDNGKVLISDKTEHLIKELGQKDFTFTFNKKLDEIPSQLKEHAPKIINNGLGLKFTCTDAEGGINKVINDINKIGVQITDISTDETDLEDVFKELVKK